MNISRCIVTLVFLLPVMAMAGVFPDIGYAPPKDWSAPTFVLSQSYPSVKPTKPNFPWESVDFAKDPAGYMEAVIGYCFEGNIAANFKPEQNAVRSWFHAPWLHYGANGREFVNGLTHERTSRPYELAAGQTQPWGNVAVGFYNDLGGYTIGTVWANPTAPDAAKAAFPEGTVSFKLLFTTAPVSAVPMLAGSPEWVADIDRSSTAAAVLASKVRLLQIDIAVKDKRSSCGGWIFGTFHYDASMPGVTPWQKLRPLTLQWGNDVGLTPAIYNSGKMPKESWVNPVSPLTIYRKNPPAGVPAPSTFGWAGRSNGPVDNPVSACMSCHSTAQMPATSPMIPPGTDPDSAKLRWFRNLGELEAFDHNSMTLDFSLQLGVGIQNLAKAQSAPATPMIGLAAKPKAESVRAKKSEPLIKEYEFTREP